MMNCSRDGGCLEPLLSFEVYRYNQILSYCIIGPIVSVTGCVTNVINILIFTKMGFKDPMNISLLGLAISDFVSCLSVTWYYFCTIETLIPQFQAPWKFGHYLFGSWPHWIAVRITITITTFITIERCLCVTFPIKVKELITSRRVTVITASIFTVFIVVTSPVFYFNKMKWVFYPELNRSLFTLIFTRGGDNPKEHHYKFLMLGLGTIYSIIAFGVTIFSTIILIRHLRKSAQWRKKATGIITNVSNPNTKSSESGNQTSGKDTKVAKMVMMISTLFIVCFTPIMVSTASLALVPEFREEGAYKRMLSFIYGFNFLMGSINAAFNIVIYYRMSSNYKAAFDRVFGRSKSIN